MLKCSRFFPINRTTFTPAGTLETSDDKCDSNTVKELIPNYGETSQTSTLDTQVYCQPTQETTEEDLLHMDFSQDFGDELPEIHMGKTDDVTATVQKYIGDDITPFIWRKILFAFIYSKCDLSLEDTLDALKNPNITISKDATLSVLLEAFQMMENNFTSVDAVLLRNLSSCMVRFTSNVGDDDNDTPHSWGMRERVTTNDTTNYFKGLLIFLLHVKNCSYADNKGLKKHYKKKHPEWWIDYNKKETSNEDESVRNE